MTAYNNAPYIEAAVRSVLEQALPPKEVIVVDDGSTDDTKAVLGPLMDRIRYIRRDNGGLGAARNTGLEAATSEYVAFCDADDIHLPHRFSSHVALLDKHPSAALVFSEFSTWNGEKVLKEFSLRGRWLGPAEHPFDEEIQRAFGAGQPIRSFGLAVPKAHADRQVYVGKIAPLIATMHIAWGGVAMFRRSALTSIGGHDPSLRRYTDWYVVSRLSKSFPLIFLDVPVILYRVHEGQLTKKPALGAKCYLEIIERVWKADPVFYAKHRQIVDRAIASAHLQLGAVARDEGDAQRAQSHYSRSILARPRQKRVYLDWLKATAKRFTAR